VGQFGRWHWGKLRAGSTQPYASGCASARTATRERSAAEAYVVYVEGLPARSQRAFRAEQRSCEARADQYGEQLAPVPPWPAHARAW